MRLRISVVLSVLLGAASASAQHRHVAVPRACTVTPPATLLGVQTLSPLAATISDSPPTLWIMYSDRDAQNPSSRVVSILQAGNIDSPRPEIHLWQVGPGTVPTGAVIAATNTHVLAAYPAREDAIGVFSHPLAGGADHTAMVTAAARPLIAGVVTVGSRALLAWDDDGRHVSTAWLSASGEPAGASHVWPGAYRSPTVTAGFGGLVLAEDPDPEPVRLAIGRAAASPRPVTVSAPNDAPIASVRAASGPAGSFVAFLAGGRPYVAALAQPTRQGRNHALSDEAGSPVAPELAVGGTAWGAVAAWTDNGVVRAIPVSADGQPVGTPMALLDAASRERASFVAAAGWMNNGIVVWSANDVQPGPRNPGQRTAIRMVRMACQ